MQIISRNEPLLFVHGPPVFIKVDVTDEESTSVFVQNLEEQMESSNAEEIVNPSIMRRITYLDGAFQKEVYRPLQFDLGDETIIGALENIDRGTAYIELISEDAGIVGIEISKIKEIYWRGKPFTEE